MREKEYQANLKLQYKKVLEIGMIASLAIIILVMQGYKKVKIRQSKIQTALEEIQVEEIPQTEQQRQAPAPSRPTVPIASEDESLPEDETIDETFLDLDEEPPPPPPPPDDAGDMPTFVPYDEPPQPIGGYAAIQRNLKYPEIARRAGIEGRVMIWAQVDEQGNVVNTRVMQSLGPNGCDEAAMAAIKKVKWKPAMQRDRPVKVWIAVPVNFRLRGG